MNKKTLLFGLTLLSSSLFFSSCSQDQFEDQPETKQGENFVTIGVDSKTTRTSYNQNGSKLETVWAAGDKILVHGKDASGKVVREIFTLSEGAGTKKAKFVNAHSNLTTASTSQITITYPATDYTEIDNLNGNPSVSYNISDQGGTLEKLSNSDIMMGTANLSGSGTTFSANVQLKHQLPVFHCQPKFPVAYSGKIVKIDIAGSSTVIPCATHGSSAGYLQVIEDGSSQMGGIEIKPENGMTVTNGAVEDFYVRLLPGKPDQFSHTVNAKYPLVFYFTMEDGKTFSKSFTNTKSFNGGTEYKLPITVTESNFTYAFSDGNIMTLDQYYKDASHTGYPIAWVVNNSNGSAGTDAKAIGNTAVSRIAIGLIDAKAEANFVSNSTEYEFAWELGTTQDNDNWKADGSAYPAFSSDYTLIDNDGYGHTYNTMKNTERQGTVKANNRNFPAFYVVGQRYGQTSDTKNILPCGEKPIPNNAFSKWFVPSATQWYTYLHENLGVTFDEHLIYEMAPTYPNGQFGVIAEIAMTQIIPAGAYKGNPVGEPMVYGQYACSSEDLADWRIPVHLMYGREENRSMTRIQLAPYGGQPLPQTFPVRVRPFIAVPAAE